MALRLMVYDRTCVTTRGLPLGLSHAWAAGGPLYRGLGRIDAYAGATSWDDALHWLGTVRPYEPIAEIQFWGHGNRGAARVAADRLTAASLAEGHPHRPALERIRERMCEDGLWWFRTCDTFGADRGQDFARRWTDFFGHAAAGHTYVIGTWQSGLHRLLPGQAPHWSAWEGLRGGTPSEPLGSLPSWPWRAHTITFLHGAVPDGW